MSLQRGRASSGGFGSNERLSRLESLVDELIKDVPEEAKVRSCMEAVGLVYSPDPIECMNRTLAALDGIRMAEQGRRQKGEGEQEQTR